MKGVGAAIMRYLLHKLLKGASAESSASRAFYREGPGGAGGGVPAGGEGTMTGAGDVYDGCKPPVTGIWLPLVYLHCM